jgi:hypothetical protein
MQLENYTNVDIFKRAFQQEQVAHSHGMVCQPGTKLIDLHAKPNVQHSWNPY